MRLKHPKALEHNKSWRYIFFIVFYYLYKVKVRSKYLKTLGYNYDCLNLWYIFMNINIHQYYIIIITYGHT